METASSPAMISSIRTRRVSKKSAIHNLTENGRRTVNLTDSESLILFFIITPLNVYKLHTSYEIKEYD